MDERTLVYRMQCKCAIPEQERASAHLVFWFSVDDREGCIGGGRGCSDPSTFIGMGTIDGDSRPPPTRNRTAMMHDVPHLVMQICKTDEV